MGYNFRNIQGCFMRLLFCRIGSNLRYPIFFFSQSSQRVSRVNSPPALRHYS